MSDQIQSDLTPMTSDQIGSDLTPVVSDSIRSDLMSVTSGRIASDPTSIMFGPIESDPHCCCIVLQCNINDSRSGWIRSGIDDAGSDQTGSGPRGDHGDRSTIPSCSLAAAICRGPLLAAEAGTGSVSASVPVGLRSPRRLIVARDTHSCGIQSLMRRGTSPREESPLTRCRSLHFGCCAHDNTRGG